MNPVSKGCKLLATPQTSGMHWSVIFNMSQHDGGGTTPLRAGRLCDVSLSAKVTHPEYNSKQ